MREESGAVREIRGAAPVSYEPIPLPPQFRRFLIAYADIKVNPPKKARAIYGAILQYKPNLGARPGARRKRRETL